MSDPELYMRKGGNNNESANQTDYFTQSEAPRPRVWGGLLSARVHDDLYNLILLVILYTIQGVPIGLAFGSIPFLLQQNVSYTDLGIFSLVGYPYSMKLLWAPIVDTIYSPLIGRRKSWIIPVQICSGLVMYWMSWRVNALIHPKTGSVDVVSLSILFFILIIFAATQDIAVDGWALSILSKENKSLSATVNTIGLNIGFFGSFTVFLALNSADFCNKYLRTIPQPEGMLELGGYLQFWAFVYLFFSVFLVFFKQERNDVAEEEVGLKEAYINTLSLARRPHVLQFLLALGICKIAFIAAESVTALELISRGFRKEELALFVLVDFPVQIVNAIIAGRLAKKGSFSPWFLGYLSRLVVSFLATLLVAIYPSTPTETLPTWYFGLVFLFSLMSSSVSTFMFVSMGGFFAKISDSTMGGTYLTLLNTVSNLGGTWPKFFIMYFVDFFSIAHCEGPGRQGIAECREEHAGTCINDVEGFYIVNTVSVIVGVALFFYLKKSLTGIQKIDQSLWKMSSSEEEIRLEGSDSSHSSPPSSKTTNWST